MAPHPVKLSKLGVRLSPWMSGFPSTLRKQIRIQLPSKTGQFLKSLIIVTSFPLVFNNCHHGTYCNLKRDIQNIPTVGQ